MGARQDVDAVDLMQAEPIDCAPEMGLADRTGPCCPEPLRGQRDPSGFGERQCPGQSRPIRREAHA